MKLSNHRETSKLSFSDHDMGSKLLEKHRIYHLTREDEVEQSETLGQILVDKCKEREISLTYDVSYGGYPNELRYSEFFAGLGGIAACPCCGPMIRLIMDDEYDTSDNIDFADYIVSRHDKYILHSYDIEPIECSVILPGSNVLKDVVDKVKLNAAASLGAQIKPHPLTNRNDLERLGEYKGLLIPSMYSGFNVMMASRYLFSTGTSELGLYAMLLGKHVIDISTNVPKGGYFDIFKESVKAENQKEKLNWLLNHPGMGIFLPNRLDRFDVFLDYYQKFLEKHKDGLPPGIRNS